MILDVPIIDKDITDSVKYVPQYCKDWAKEQLPEGETLEQYLHRRLPSYLENYIQANFMDIVSDLVEYDMQDPDTLQMAEDIILSRKKMDEFDQIFDEFKNKMDATILRFKNSLH